MTKFSKTLLLSASAACLLTTANANAVQTPGMVAIDTPVTVVPKPTPTPTFPASLEGSAATITPPAQPAQMSAAVAELLDLNKPECVIQCWDASLNLPNQHLIYPKFFYNGQLFTGVGIGGGSVLDQTLCTADAAGKSKAHFCSNINNARINGKKLSDVCLSRQVRVVPAQSVIAPQWTIPLVAGCGG